MKIFPITKEPIEIYCNACNPLLATMLWRRLHKADPKFHRTSVYALGLTIHEDMSITLRGYGMRNNYFGGIGDLLFEEPNIQATSKGEVAERNRIVLDEMKRAATDQYVLAARTKEEAEIDALMREMFPEAGLLEAAL